jgi:peptidoglycan/xylan/chitin deacetylase (PgdA/CDA1 family)
MYHAVSEGAPGDAGDDAQDPHYTVAKDTFARHLRMAAANGGARSARDWLVQGRDAALLLTFDDGHLSNYTLAYPLLREHGCDADFFVNPERVGKSGYASWPQLREMAEGGMSIQSHSFSHRYLTSLSPDALREELSRSKSEIEQHVGQPVTLLAPPGGRMPRGLGDLARTLGYRWVLSSRPGTVRRGASDTVLPRMAVTANLDEPTLVAWLDSDSRAMLRARVRYAVLAGLKHALGDSRYERMRSRVLGRSAGT